MQSPKAKLTLYVAISTGVVFIIWLGTLKYSIRREIDNSQNKASLFGDIKISLDEAWAQKPDLNLSAATNTPLLQGGPEISKKELEDLINNLEIKPTTTTPLDTNIKVE